MLSPTVRDRRTLITDLVYSAAIERLNSFCWDGTKSLELSDRKGEVEESGTHSAGGVFTAQHSFRSIQKSTKGQERQIGRE